MPRRTTPNNFYRISRADDLERVDERSFSNTLTA